VLSETDSFGLVVFDNEVSTFQPALVAGTRELRDKAHEFLMQVNARGGTELALGFLQATKLLEGKGGDILILTDGQVSGTEKILGDARSAGVRLHCLGIGSASEDRFLALLARETGGVSRFVTPRERVDLSVVDLFAFVGRPVVSGLKAGANIQPEPPSFVFSGTPVLLFGEVGETAENQIELTWQGGGLRLPVRLSESDIGETVGLLQGSRLITDWESRYPSAEAWATLEKRKQSRVAARLLELSRTYALASREVSLVAVVTRPGDRPGNLPETRVVPVGMAQDTAFEAYFRSQFSPDGFIRMFSLNAPQENLPAVTPEQRSSLRFEKGNTRAARPAGHESDTRPLSLRSSRTEFESAPDCQSGLFSRRKGVDVSAGRLRSAETAEDILLDLAARMDSDGGMPGTNHESRAVATVIALLAFLSQGHTSMGGAFRSHVARLVSFLTTLTGLSRHQQTVVAAVIELARKGTAPPGDWITLAHTSGNHWRTVENSVLKG
jgi:Ca-activated chloride channel family protein